MRIEIFAHDFFSRAMVFIVRSSSLDSILKHIIFLDNANLISSSVLPTPENTVLLGSPPA